MVKNSTEQKELNTAQQNAELPVIGGKACSACKMIKPTVDFSKNKNELFGLHHRCKKCRSIKRSGLNAAKSYDVPKNMILCRECGKLKEKSELNFYKCKLLESSKTLICIECRREKGRVNAKLKRSEANERHRKWRDLNRGHVRSYSKARKSDVKRATPKWFEHELVERVYKEAVKRGWHVDHIVPIRSKIVCGLHCHANLQILEASINCSKKNNHWPDMP